MQMTDWILPLFVVWALGLLYVLFRRSIPVYWKISAVLVFVFYGAWYSPVLTGPAFQLWRDAPLRQAPLLLAALIQVLPLLLLIFWPVLLFVAARERTAENAVRLLRTLTLMTLFYWVFWLGAYATGQDMSPKGLQETLQGLVPEDLEMNLPDLPQPPAGPATP